MLNRNPQKSFFPVLAFRNFNANLTESKKATGDNRKRFTLNRRPTRGRIVRPSRGVPKGILSRVFFYQAPTKRHFRPSVRSGRGRPGCGPRMNAKQRRVRDAQIRANAAQA